MTLESRKAQLLARRADLLGDLQEIEDALDEPAPKDWEDAASERQGDEVLESLGLADQNEVRRIDAALERIEDGTYGICVRCGETISEERLDIVPDTPLCRTFARG